MKKFIIRSNPKHAGYEMQQPILFISKIESPFTAQENPHVFNSTKSAKEFISENLNGESEMWDIVEATNVNINPSILSEVYE